MTVNYFRSSLVLATDTNRGISYEPVYNAEQAWKIIFAHARHWQIEMSLRFTKSEMAFESPRLIKWKFHLKFLLIASLAYAFLFSLISVQISFST
jgi:hypothetical protein